MSCRANNEQNEDAINGQSGLFSDNGALLRREEGVGGIGVGNAFLTQFIHQPGLLRSRGRAWRDQKSALLVSDLELLLQSKAAAVAAAAGATHLLGHRRAAVDVSFAALAGIEAFASHIVVSRQEERGR